MKPHPRDVRNGAFAAIPVVTVVHSDSLFWLRRSTRAGFAAADAQSAPRKRRRFVGKSLHIELIKHPINRIACLLFRDATIKLAPFD